MDPRTTRTDASGRFALTSLQPLVRPHVLVAMAAGHGRLTVCFEAPGPAACELGDIVLPPGRLLAGRVVGPKGDPVPRVRIVLRGGNDDRDRLLPAPLAETVLWYGNTETRFTDDLGRFAFRDLASGTYELAVRPDEGPAAVRSLALHGDVRDVEVSLELVHELVVRVLDGRGQPVAGIHAYARYGRETVWVVTDEQGTARVALPAPADRVGVAASLVGVLATKPLDVHPGAAEVTLTVRRAAHVRGRVVDEDGATVPGVQIVSVCSGERVGLTKSDADGRFAAVAPDGGVADLLVLSETLDGQLRAVPGGAEDVTLVVRPR
jgi:hypothetical protein